MLSAPPLYGDFCSGLVLWRAHVLHKQQLSDKTSRVLGLEKVLVENTCLTVKCLLPGVHVCFNWALDCLLEKSDGWMDGPSSVSAPYGSELQGQGPSSSMFFMAVSNLTCYLSLRSGRCCMLPVYRHCPRWVPKGVDIVALWVHWQGSYRRYPLAVHCLGRIPNSLRVGYSPSVFFMGHV